MRIPAGPQLISSQENKACVFKLLPGLNNPSQGYDEKGSMWPVSPLGLTH